MWLPNFLIIGAPKAATTSLYHYLEQHPQVYLSAIKEPHFFSYGEMDLRGRLVRMPRRMVLSASGYEKLFARVREETAVGEASTSYLESRRAAERIATRLPGARLIAVLRQPAERAHSQYLMNRQRLFERAPTFEAALENERDAIARNVYPYINYRNTGFYHQHLSYYYELFPETQVQVLLHEDLNDRPIETMKAVFRFLNIDDTSVPDTSMRHNISGVPRNLAVAALLKTTFPVLGYLERSLPPRLISRIGNILLKAPSINPDTRARLTADFREDIGKLQDLIGRDLSHWLR